VKFFGNIYIVLFNPNDIDILKGGPANRRRFLDIMISQLRKGYIYNLNQYMKTIEQRNFYLRQIKNENKKEELLEIWDEKLAETGYKIYLYRNEYINKIKEKIKTFHSSITGEKEEIKIKYICNCEDKEKYLQILKENRKSDIQKGFTQYRYTKRRFFCLYKWKTGKCIWISGATKNNNYIFKDG
jgi:DNA replication and repair protein RecF